MVWGEKGGQKGRRRRADEVGENLSEWDSQHGGRTEMRANKEIS